MSPNPKKIMFHVIELPRSHRVDPRALYERCAPNLRKLAAEILGDEAEAEDIVQETFLELLEGRADDVAPGEKASLWLADTVVRLSLKRQDERGHPRRHCVVRLLAAIGPGEEGEQVA